MALVHLQEACVLLYVARRAIWESSKDMVD